MRQPRLLLVDEISMGLAPMLVEVVFGALCDLRAQGYPCCWSSRMPAKHCRL